MIFFTLFLVSIAVAVVSTWNLFQHEEGSDYLNPVNTKINTIALSISIISSVIFYLLI